MKSALSGRSFLDAVKGRETGRPIRLVVGLARPIDVHRVPDARAGIPPQRRRPGICREAHSTEAFLGELAVQAVDVLLSDAPAAPGTAVRVFNHLLGECGTAFFAAPQLAKSCRRRFPQSLDGVPFLLPGGNSVVPRQNSFRARTIDVSAGGVDAQAVMIHGFLLAIDALRAVFLSQADLVLENLALRQQLAAFARNGQRPRIVAADRLFRLALRRLWLRWSDVLVFVKPETAVRWHQAGFRRYWTWLSQRRRRGRPPIDARLCALIHRLALENPTWGRRASTASCASFSSVPVPIKKLVGFKKIDLRSEERRVGKECRS